MKTPIRLIVLCLALAAIQAFAVEVETNSTPRKTVALVEVNSTASKNVALVESESSLSFEFDAEAAYFGDGDLERGETGTVTINDFDGGQARARFLLLPRTKIGILRLGVQTEAYSFGFGGNAAIPDDLHSLLVIARPHCQILRSDSKRRRGLRNRF